MNKIIVIAVLCLLGWTLFVMNNASKNIAVLKSGVEKLEKLKGESDLWKDAFKDLIWIGHEVAFKATKTVETNKDMTFNDFAVRAYAGAYADQKVKEDKADTMTVKGNQLWKKYFNEGMKWALEDVPLLKEK